MTTGLMAMVYKPNSFRLDCGRGAITQLSGMEHHQTRINATELMGKIMPTGIESSTSRAISPKKSDKRSMLSLKEISRYISG
jgi:hypothetical protein